MSTLSSGVSSFNVIANEDRLYRVGLAGGSFFSHSKVAPALWCGPWHFTLEASSLMLQCTLSSHFPAKVATLVPSTSLTTPWTLHRARCISIDPYQSDGWLFFFFLYLTRISIKKRLFFKCQLAWISFISTYAHCAMVMAIESTKDKVINCCCNLRRKIETLKHDWQRSITISFRSECACTQTQRQQSITISSSNRRIIHRVSRLNWDGFIKPVVRIGWRNDVG